MARRPGDRKYFAQSRHRRRHLVAARGKTDLRSAIGPIAQRSIAACNAARWSPIPRLRIELRPSRAGCALVVAGCMLASLLLAVLSLPVAVVVPGTAVVAAVLFSGFWRCTGRGLPALLHVGIDRRLAVTGCDGRSREGAILRRLLRGPLVDDHCLALGRVAMVASRERHRRAARHAAVRFIPPAARGAALRSTCGRRTERRRRSRVTGEPCLRVDPHAALGLGSRKQMKIERHQGFGQR